MEFETLHIIPEEITGGEAAKKKAVISEYSLDGDLCLTKRAHQELLPGVSGKKGSKYISSVVSSVVSQQVVRDEMFGGRKSDLSAITKQVASLYEDVPMRSAQEKKVKIANNAKRVMRLLNSTDFQNPWYEMPRNRTTIVHYEDEDGNPQELCIKLSPSWFRFNGTDELELIRLVDSKPTVSQKAMATKKKYLFGLKMADDFAAELGNPAIKWVRYTVIFLARNDDVDSGDNRNFTHNFYATKGGNVITLCDEVGLPGYGLLIQEAAQEFASGIPSQECTAKDCEWCTTRAFCKFEPAPLPLEKVPSAFNVKEANISEAQMEAIEHEAGNVVIDSVPGSGKTFVLILHILTLIMKQVPLNQIYAVTHTDAAAEEMKKRLVAFAKDFDLDIDPEQVHMSTIHSWCYEILKREEVYKSLGYTAEPRLLNVTDRSKLIEHLVNEAVERPYYDAMGNEVRNPLLSLNWGHFAENSRYSRGVVAVVAEVFDVMKSHNLCPADVTEIRRHVRIDGRSTNGERVVDISGLLQQIALLYPDYTRFLLENNLIEFDDMIKSMFDLAHDDPFFFEQFGYSHIIVDEAQDMDQEQIDILNMLRDCPTHTETFLVGDVNQSIYAFRGTSNKYLKNPEQYFPGTFDRIALATNYRSTPEICEFGNQIKNKNDLAGPDLVAARPSGKPVVVQGFLKKEEEKEYVVNGVLEHIAAGVPLNDIAIICRDKDECREIAGRLHDAGVLCAILVPEILIDNSRVVAAIALCDAMQDYTDTVDIQVYANALMGGGLLALSREEAEEKCLEVKTQIGALMAIGDPVQKKDKLLEMFHAIDLDDDEIYQKFLQMLEWKPSVESIFEFIEDFKLYGTKEAGKRDHSYPGVAIVTAHSSKGLEWSVVYNMISKYHGNGRSSRFSPSDFRCNTEPVQEERRLFFVAATRARDELYITAQYVASGKQGDYTYNHFLKEAYDAVGQVFSVANIETERMMKAAEEKAAKAEAAAQEAKTLAAQRKEEAEKREKDRQKAKKEAEKAAAKKDAKKAPAAAAAKKAS